MPKYVMLSTLGPDGSARLLENHERLREVSAEVEAMGVRVLEQFAVLGHPDGLEAPFLGSTAEGPEDLGVCVAVAQRDEQPDLHV